MNKNKYGKLKNYGNNESMNSEISLRINMLMFNIYRPSLGLRGKRWPD